MLYASKSTFGNVQTLSALGLAMTTLGKGPRVQELYRTIQGTAQGTHV